MTQPLHTTLCALLIFSMIKKLSGWILDSVNYPHAGSEALMEYTVYLHHAVS